MPDGVRTAAKSAGEPIQSDAPKIWILLGKGAGGNAQMLNLAAALGWPYTAKQIRYNLLNHLPNVMLGATAITVDRRNSDALLPPWPDLVIAASRRAAPLARWIRKCSGGRARLVHLLHTQAPLHHFDLVVTLPQYRLPQADNILHNTLPLNTLDSAVQSSAAARWQPQFAQLPRPWIALLVGGSSSSYRLDAATATRLGEAASAAAHEAGGSLLVTTSPRTSAAAAAALMAAIKCPAYCYQWQSADVENPYQGILALADRFIVTADSASLPAEACATGRPVELFEWRPRNSVGTALPWRWLPLADRAYRALIYWGLIKPRRDFGAFHRELSARGLIGRNAAAGQVPDDLEKTVARIRKLMASA